MWMMLRTHPVAMQRYNGNTPLNVGTGEDVTIRELAELLKDVVGYRGTLRFDAGKPDGMPRKLLDVSRLAALGWRRRCRYGGG